MRRNEKEEAMSKEGLCAIVTGSASGLGAATAGLLVFMVSAFGLATFAQAAIA